VVSVEHVPEDDVERYAMRSLPAPESDRLEEHLLVCSVCRGRLESTEQYVAVMRSAAGKAERDRRIGGLWAASLGGSNGPVRIALRASCEAWRAFQSRTGR
jgi:hypothetical protein